MAKAGCQFHKLATTFSFTTRLMGDAAIQDHVCGNPQFKFLIGDSRTRDLIRLHHLSIVSCKYQETSDRMNVAGRVRASFDALLLRAEQNRWVNFTGEGTRQCACKVQLIQSEAGYLLNCKQDGQVNFDARVHNSSSDR